MVMSMDAFQISIRRHLGKIAVALVSLATVIGHYTVYRQTQYEIKETVKTITQEQMEPIKDGIAQTNIDLEKRFVTKPDAEKIAIRIDTLNEQIANMREQVAKLEGFLRGRDRIRTEIFWGKR